MNSGSSFLVQSSAKRRAPGLVNFVPAVDLSFLPCFACSNHASWARLLAEPCTLLGFQLKERSQRLWTYLSASALLICEQRRDGLCHPLLVEVAAREDEEGENDVEEYVFAHPRVSVLEVGYKNVTEKSKQTGSPCNFIINQKDE